ncbi:aminotransferase [Streptomyces sp. ICBB 8177]|nr:aminotransferase class I/II-fold pyridoxal phosphate-dependent enzyme [Streptomyces sp. ICBB 8177]PWI43794.1 aminotransferase [Streptomyces sp. ICBB 8177]
MNLTTATEAELLTRRDRLREQYAALKSRGRSLDLTRGKPSAAQLDLSAPLLSLPGPEAYTGADGTDVRNYGGAKGLPELREIFSGPFQVPADRLLALGGSSLELMYDCVAHALLLGLPGSVRPWAAEQSVAFLCPVPGYDRHFGICEQLGIDMIPVPMTADGPDMDRVEHLAARDPQIKGIWCVPKYSNPTGVSYTPQTVRRLAAMPTAAPDFRIFWDNAYAVHHLTAAEHEIADVLALAAAHGNEDRPFVFGSTSKITFPGAGVAFLGSSPANVRWTLRHLSRRTIGPDKVNQLRHTLLLRDADGVREHMRRHREVLAPRFDLVERVLTERLGGSGIASWTRPEGGYFVTLTVPDGCATLTVSLAAQAGVALTPAGAPYPYGRDPRDHTIRIAPSYPSLPELSEALEALTVCVLLAGVERLLGT